MKTKVIFTCGIQASGKSSWAKKFVAENKEGKVIGVSSSSKYIQEELEDMLETTGINNYFLICRRIGIHSWNSRIIICRR